MSSSISIIAIILLIVIGIFLVVSNIRIVPQAKAYVVERLGSISDYLAGGIACKNSSDRQDF